MSQAQMSNPGRPLIKFVAFLAFTGNFGCVDHDTNVFTLTVTRPSAADDQGRSAYYYRVISLTQVIFCFVWSLLFCVS
jgi:hypothetical protein